eukprot:765988-Hanusia_phi.AAC.5
MAPDLVNVNKTRLASHHMYEFEGDELEAIDDHQVYTNIVGGFKNTCGATCHVLMTLQILTARLTESRAKIDFLRFGLDTGDQAQSLLDGTGFTQ